MGSIGTAAKNSVVTIDRGTLDGVKSGQVLAFINKVKRSGSKNQRKIKLPNNKSVP
jgi:hypothetical protein